jgi:hypothetical protein
MLKFNCVSVSNQPTHAVSYPCSIAH